MLRHEARSYHGVSLARRAWKAVKQPAKLAACSVPIESPLDHADHELVGKQLARRHQLLGALAKLRWLLCIRFSTKHVSCADVANAILLHQPLTLRSLAHTWWTENQQLVPSISAVTTL